MVLSGVALFRLIAATGSLAGAAREAGTSPMAVSRQLAKLEQEVGARLIHRTTRSLSLTADGEAFLPFAEDMLNAQADALSSLGDGSGGFRGTIRITAPNVVGRTIAAPMMWKLMRANPALRTELVLSDRPLDLIEGRIDVAIRVAHELPLETIASRLSSTERVLCASPRYIQEHGVPKTVADLAKHACLALHDVPLWRFERDEKPVDVRVSSMVASNTVDAILSAALADLGIIQVIYWDVVDQLRSGDLVRIRLEDAEDRDSTMWAVYPSSRQVPARVKAYVDLVRAHLGSLEDNACGNGSACG